VNPRLGAWLNGSCRVIRLEEATLELGFWNKVHFSKVDTDVRPLVEQQAEALLRRRVELKVTLIEDGTTAAAPKAARKGHLAEAARQLGAVPVQKEG
jgi:hypothetical protein